MYWPDWDEEKLSLLENLGDSVRPVMASLGLDVRMRFWRSDWCASNGVGWVEWIVPSGDTSPMQFEHALEAALAFGPWQLRGFAAVLTSMDDCLREVVRANGWEELAAGEYDWGDFYGDGELLGAYIPDNEFVSCDRLYREFQIDVCMHAKVSFEPKAFELDPYWLCNEE